jgi:hypothetical protein
VRGAAGGGVTVPATGWANPAAATAAAVMPEAVSAATSAQAHERAHNRAEQTRYTTSGNSRFDKSIYTAKPKLNARIIVPVFSYLSTVL